MDEGATTSRGCFFCRSGKEMDVVRRFETAFPGGGAVAPTKTRYRRKGDTAIEEKVLLLPGYVFFELDEGIEMQAGFDAMPVSLQRAGTIETALRFFTRENNVFKLLRYSNGEWKLQGFDDQFAKLLFETGGHVGISQAYFDEGNRIRILDGFLKDYEGYIIRVNKKRKTVEVSIDFQGKKVNLKLGYELVEKVE